MRFLTALLLALIASTSTARPNIVFVLVDDLDNAVFKSALDLGVLPNIKTRLIDQGTTFEQMFVTQSLCCPSRATFHTGQYPQNHQVTGNEGLYGKFKRKKEPQALGTWLKQAHADGMTYRTGYLGKYLNGSGDDPSHVPPGWDTWRALLSDSEAQCMYGYTLANTGGTPETVGTTDADYQTDKLANLAVEFIQVADPNPFFLVVAPTAPHGEGCLKTEENPQAQVRTAPRYIGQTPLVPLPTWASFRELDITDKPQWMQDNGRLPAGALATNTTLYNEKIAALRPIDDLVGRVLDELTLQGKTDTVVIFTSDNGYQYGTHNRKGKQDFYEESARVPMVIKLPLQTEPFVQQSWVLNNDWAPTIAAFAGVPELINPDGRSLIPLLGNTTLSTRQTFMIRTGDNPTSAARTRKTMADGEDGHIPFLAIRTRKTSITNDPAGSIYVYAETYNSDGTTSQELYDLTTDPDQMGSIHADPAQAARITALKAKLMELKVCRGGGCRKLED